VDPPVKRAQDRWDDLLESCCLCGRRCGVDRRGGERGACNAGRLPRVARWLAHTGEEPPLSGCSGSGTIFFSACSLRCIFCQNASISQSRVGEDVHPDRLAGIMLELQERGCHNINLVSPTHYAPPVSVAVEISRREGLSIPVVYNTHGYDSSEALACMNGKVDIYLPDMKYANDDLARELSGARGYRKTNREALGEMFAQVGHLREDPETGLAVRGMLVRILLLPGGLEGAKASLSYLKNRFSTDLAVSLMAQYAPVHKAVRREPLDRPLREEEYRSVVAFAEKLGFQRIWIQDLGAASVGVPDFSALDPFEF
jgi:putative pyruvate formate lyase activating enzyme